MKTYIHYGHTKFDPLLCETTKYCIRSKPDKGVWASPVDCDWGWKDWCESEFFRDCEEENSFKFTLSKDAKILEIHEESDILDYVIPSENSFRSTRLSYTSILDSLNLEKLYHEFDGIELFYSENPADLRYGIFNSWDCDSIVVWNKNVIDVVA